MAKEPFRISDIDLNNIIYKDIKNSNDKTIINIKYKKRHGFKNFVIQTPSLLNMNEPVFNNNYWNLDINLTGKREKKVNEFKAFLNNLDKKIMYDADINSLTWLKNSDSQISYQKTIRKSENGNTIRLKLLSDSNFKTIIQLNNKDTIEIKDIPKNSWVKMILEVYAVWINKTSFGIFLKPILISFTPIEIPKYTFIEDSEENEAEKVNQIFEDDDISVFVKNERHDNYSDKESTQLAYPVKKNNESFSPTSSEE